METREIRQTIRFPASAHEIYDILMDSERHGGLTNTRADIDNRVGGKFTAADGYISGENLELVENRRIVQRWRGSDWPEGHFSTVTFELRDLDGETELILSHEDVPADKEDEVAQGWYKYYWEPLMSGVRAE